MINGPASVSSARVGYILKARWLGYLLSASRCQRQGGRQKTFFVRPKSSLEDVYHTRTGCVAGNKIIRRPNIAVAFTRALTHPNCIPSRVYDTCDDVPGMLIS